jgi:hypothetical protein
MVRLGEMASRIAVALRFRDKRGCAAAVLVAAAACAGGGEALAQSKLNGFYIGVRGVGSYSQILDAEFSGAPPPTNVYHDSDIVGGLGLVVGKYWHPNGIPIRT